MANTFVQDTFGQVLTISTGMDLSGNTALSLHFRKQDGATKDITSGVTVSGADADGVVTYTVLTADKLWDMDGVVRCTPRATFSAGEHEGGTPCQFTVKRRNQVV